jgi:hypothetical protein
LGSFSVVAWCKLIILPIRAKCYRLQLENWAAPDAFFRAKEQTLRNFCVFPQELLHSLGRVFFPLKLFRSTAYAQHFHYTPFSPKKQLLSAILAEKYLKYFFHFILKST